MNDIHTHNPENSPGAIVSCSPAQFNDLKVKYPSAKFSVGIHPWDTAAFTECTSSGLSFRDSENLSKPDFTLLDSVARDEAVVAIGETGLDALRGASIDVQEAVFRHHIELSEQLAKPLVIHCVKGWEKLLALHKEYSPRQHWAIHGFRGKPELARQLAVRGIYISLGEKFNPGVLAVVPRELILSETDESAVLPSLPFDTVPNITRFLSPVKF